MYIWCTPLLEMASPRSPNTFITFFVHSWISSAFLQPRVFNGLENIPDRNLVRRHKKIGQTSSHALLPTCVYPTSLFLFFLSFFFYVVNQWLTNTFVRSRFWDIFLLSRLFRFMLPPPLEFFYFQILFFDIVMFLSTFWWSWYSH